MLNPVAAGEDVKRNVQDVIGFVIGQVDLEQVQSFVDGFGQSQLAGQGMDGADAAMGDPAGAVRQFVVDRACAEGWGSGSGAVAGIEPSFDPALAVGEPESELRQVLRYFSTIDYERSSSRRSDPERTRPWWRS